jgi:hypothetical protein
MKSAHLSLLRTVAFTIGAFFSINLFGATAYNTVVTFDDPLPLAAAQAPDVWYVDRYAPAAFESFDLSGENVLRIAIDGVTDGSAGRGSQSDTFYNTQGRKFDLPQGTVALSAEVYYPSSYEGATTRARTDLWGTAYDASSSISWYPIIGVANVDGTPVIRFYDSNGAGGWVNTSITPVGDTWYRFEMILDGSEVVYLVDGSEVGRLDSGGSVRMDNVILQAYNFNDPALPVEQQSTVSYDAYWDNLAYAYPTITNLTQSTTHATIADAVAAANPADVIELSPGTYSEAPVNINQAVTIQGPNAGLAGTNTGRGAEARISNTRLSINSAGVVIDGVEIFQTDDTADAILVQSASTIRNSVIRRNGVNIGTIARGITTAVGTSGFIVENNLFSGDSSGGFFSGHKTWNSGLWINGGSGTISGNTFENCRTAMNCDDFNAGITITGNTFRTSGTYLAFGGVSPTDGQYTISGNEFYMDWADIVTNWYPSALFNNSNVAATFRIDATGNTFGGIDTASLTDEQKFHIEARMYHRGRSSKIGVVDFVANEQVVMPGTTVLSAIDAAAAADTVRVGPGTYSEVLLIDKPLSLLGPNAAISAVTGTRNTEAVLTERINISASDDVTISGFEFFEVPTTNTWTIYIYGSSNNFTFENNRFIDVEKDAIRSGITAQTSNVTVSGNLIEGMQGASASGILLGGINGTSIISDNRIDLAYNGVPTGYSGIQTPSATGLTISGNEILNTTNQGLQLAGASGNVTISNNVISNTNTSGGADKGAIRLYGTDFVGPITITGNTLAGSFNGISVKDGENIDGKVITIRDNDLSGNSNAGSYNGAAIGTLDARENYWGLPGGPNVDPSLVSGSVSFSPWYADEARTILVTAASFDDTTVPEGDTVTEGDLYIGGTYTVEGTLQVTGILTLSESGVLDVVNGELQIGGSTIAGSFTFFNSFGSVNFNDDVSITGSAEGLILISDVHVADAATITVDGTLVIDGSTFDSAGSFTLDVNPGASFTMARTVFTDGTLVIGASDVAVYDNLIENASIEVEDGAVAGIYHNIVAALPGYTLTGSVTGVVTDTVDGWANLTDPALTENNLLLDLDISALLATDRTQDTDGNVFIQPEDVIMGTIDVSALQAKISGVEMLLGYSTDYLTASTLGEGDNWQLVPPVGYDSATVIGKIDAALGVNFSTTDPDGTQLDQLVADIELTATALEGETVFFQRVKLASESFAGETRLTTGGSSPAYLTPFTANSGTITIDGTDPLIDLTTQTITQGGADVNTVTTSGAITIQGTVDITAAAFDALAGIDDVDVVVELIGIDVTVTYPAIRAASTSSVTIGGENYTKYNFSYDVVPTTLNGTYDVQMTVTDRSGNQSVSSLGTIEINKNAVDVDVQLQGVSTAVTRNVVFVFTDAGNSFIEERIIPVDFDATGVGSVSFVEVDGNSANLSAKTAWNLRQKLPVGLDGDGQATVEFLGTEQLPGGDISGDNAVNMLDYSILRFYWLSTTDSTADITADGFVNTTDFGILQGNFYTIGDAE